MIKKSTRTIYFDSRGTEFASLEAAVISERGTLIYSVLDKYPDPDYMEGDDSSAGFFAQVARNPELLLELKSLLDGVKVDD